MTITNVKQSSDQCKTTVPLLQTAFSEVKAFDAASRERIAHQAATSIVLKKMGNLQPARTGISQRCEQASQFISLQSNLVHDVGAVVVEVIIVGPAIIPHGFDPARFASSARLNI